MTDTAQRLYVLDYGLFEVHENGRVIGIQGYVIRAGDGTTILVDTGFPPVYATDGERAASDDGLGAFGRVVRLTEENLPGPQLARAGLSPGDVDLLVITHGDIDHVGGIDGFPAATIVVGRAERAMGRPRYFGDRRPVAWPDASYRLVDADEALAPGVTVLSTPGHSPGHLSLLVRLPETGAVVLTGDAISRASEPDEGFGGNCSDPTQAAASARRLLAIAAREQAMIVYGHDPDQWPTLRKAPAHYA